MPVMLCLAVFDAHSPLLYSHNVLIRFSAADASLHLCAKQYVGQRGAYSGWDFRLQNPESFSDAEDNLIFCEN